MAELINWCFEHINYWTVTLFMAIESSFIPFPSEAVVPPAAYKAAAGEMNIFLVVIFATVGANIGALFNYVLARWLGRPFVYKFAASRLGHLCLVDEEKIRRSESFFEKYGIIATLIGRLVPVIRQFISIPAGLAKMPISTFLIYTTVGAGIWNIILAGIGYYLHSFVPKEQLMDKVYEYSHAIGYSIAAVVALGLAFLVIKSFLKKKASEN
ncbi:MAG: DedA family protein [Opitutales bacterium]|nr:DedA family protein [Verrucomicrobiota bacterium]MBQ2731722.1 DedA family protein [Opitutales bacterium]